MVHKTTPSWRGSDSTHTAAPAMMPDRIYHKPTSESGHRDMRGSTTIAFVIPWYSVESGGGAEALCRSLVRSFVAQGIPVEVLTTCVKDFRSDWNKNYWKPGVYQEDGATIRRFPVRKSNFPIFAAVNAKLMSGQSITAEEERAYITEMIRSPKMVEYLQEHQKEYRAIIAIPYMFGTTYDILSVAPEKTYMIPCLHDESYAYMRIFREPFRKIRGHFFNAAAERSLAQTIFKLSDEQCMTIGAGVDDVVSPPGIFRARYRLSGDYVLYAGRKDPGKNIHLLIEYFDRYIRETDSQLKLVLIGGGRVELSEAQQERIIDLGLVSPADKYAALRDALVLCQPSIHESFSIVLMESWLAKRPVIVHEQCAVTRKHVMDSQGGLLFKSYEEFRECVLFLDAHRDITDRMGVNGEQYVRHNFTHEIVTNRYLDALFASRD